jgi:hypothetical protein
VTDIISSLLAVSPCFVSSEPTEIHNRHAAVFSFRSCLLRTATMLRQNFWRTSFLKETRHTLSPHLSTPPLLRSNLSSRSHNHEKRYYDRGEPTARRPMYSAWSGSGSALIAVGAMLWLGWVSADEHASEDGTSQMPVVVRC